jgi:hypothetical protein
VGIFYQAQDGDVLPRLDPPGQIGDDFREIGAQPAEARQELVVDLCIENQQGRG